MELSCSSRDSREHRYCVKAEPDDLLSLCVPKVFRRKKVAFANADPTDPLLMNAFNTVNLAAACIVTSTEYARELGVPRSKWIYTLGGAGTQDSSDCEYCPLLSVMEC